MQRSIENIKQLVHQKLLKITISLVKNKIESLLLSEPVSHLRDWDYGKENQKYECWTIAIDNETDTSIVYSDFGFGPRAPWGLVFANNLWIGADSGWHESLMECYLDSFSAGELPIWCVRKETENNKRQILTEKFKMDIAFIKRDKLAEIDINGRYHVDYVLD